MGASQEPITQQKESSAHRGWRADLLSLYAQADLSSADSPAMRSFGGATAASPGNNRIPIGSA